MTSEFSALPNTAAPSCPAPVIGLNLADGFTRITVLNAAGELTEEATIRSTEAAFRQRFAYLPPALVCCAYDSRFARLLAVLCELGHTMFLGGPVAKALMPAFGPLLGRIARPESVVLRRDGAGIGLLFAIERDSAWYMIGPIPAGVDLAALELSRFAAPEPVSSLEQARHLHALWSMGEILTGDRQVAAA